MYPQFTDFPTALSVFLEEEMETLSEPEVEDDLNKALFGGTTGQLYR